MRYQNPIRFQPEANHLLRVPRPIDLVALQTTAGTILTARADADFQIEHIFVANVSGSAATYTLHLVPASGSVSTANKVIDAEAISANSSSVVFALKGMMLQPGMTLRGLGSANDAINIGGWGYDFQGQYSS